MHFPELRHLVIPTCLIRHNRSGTTSHNFPQYHLSTFITLATFSYSSAYIFLSKLSPSEARLTHPLPRLFISSQARTRSPGLSSARTEKTCEACITSF